MKFEEFTLETNNSFHRYLVGGECKLNYDLTNQLISIQIHLDLPILFTGTARLIEINGVDFSCSKIHVVGSVIEGYVKSIESQVYTKKLLCNN